MSSQWAFRFRGCPICCPGHYRPPVRDLRAAPIGRPAQPSRRICLLILGGGGGGRGGRFTQKDSCEGGRYQVHCKQEQEKIPAFHALIQDSLRSEGDNRSTSTGRRQVQAPSRSFRNAALSLSGVHLANSYLWGSFCSSSASSWKPS